MGLKKILKKNLKLKIEVRDTPEGKRKCRKCRKKKHHGQGMSVCDDCFWEPFR